MSLRVWLPLNGDLHNQGLTLLPDTSINTFTYDTGKIGQCATGRVAWHLNEEILGNTWSVAMWVKPESLGTANNILFCKNGTSATDCHIYFSIISTTQLNLGVNGPSSSVTATGQTFTTGTWYHVAATYDGTTATIYLNGIELKHGTVTTACPTGRLNMNINGRSTNAANTSTTGHITCSFNDFRLYDHCLSAAEVHEIAQGLILHYKLDDDYQYKWNLLNNTKYCTRENVRTNSWARGDVLSPGILQLTPTTAYAYIRYVTEMDYKDWNNKTYTVSFDAQEIAAENEDYNVSSAIISYIGFMPEDRADSSTLISTAYDKFRRQDYDIKGEGWQHYTYTFTLPDALNRGEDTALVDGSKFTVEFGKSASKKPLQIKNIKLELGASDTGWMPSKTDMNLNENVIMDSSGYNHNGTITGTLSTDLSSAKHGAAIYCANGLTNYIDTPTLTLPTDNITLNIWFKSANDAPNDNYHIAVNSIGSSTGRNYYEMAVHRTGYFRGGLSINGQRKVADCTSLTGCDGQWHMLTMTYDGVVKKLYFDGELKKSDEIAITTGLRPTAAFRLFRDGYSDYEFSAVEASLSDFRIYSTPLLDTDIKQLYNMSMKVDHEGNGHCFEINESNFNKLSKRGILFNQMVEPYLVLSDGSKWKLMLYHYVDHGNNLFTEENATYCNDLGLYSRLGEIQNYQYNDQYEYYVIQDGKEFRWTQTSSPISATVQNLTVVSGYLDPVNGLAKKASSSYTYIGYNSWWGACGSYRSYSLDGKRGIPGFGTHNATGICEDYLIVYTRIYEPTFKIKNASCEATQFIEY